MNKFSCLAAFVVLGAALPSLSFASDFRGGVHIVMPDTCEVVDDKGECADEAGPGMEQPHWYWESTRENIFEDPEEDRDVPGRLENDTQWPGQREEFSDYLFR